MRIEPIEDFPNVLPLVPSKVTRSKERVRRHKHALWLVGVFVNSSCDKAEEHQLPGFQGRFYRVDSISQHGF